MILRGSGLPTLLLNKRFSFHEKAKIPDEFKDKLENARAVDIIRDIIKYKLSKSGCANRLYLLDARTGSGKSTTFIQNLYDNFIRGTKNKIVIAEPRVPLCSSNAYELIRWTEHKTEDTLGGNFGYITGPEKVICSNSSNGCLYYCTIQILANSLNEILVKNTLEDNKIKIIVIDEAHLLEIQTLQTINLIYEILKRFGDNEKCPLFIFSSGTLNINPFLNYFLDLVKNEMPTIEDIYKNPYMLGFVGGSPNFDVKLKYLDNKTINTYLKKTSKTDLTYVEYGKIISNLIISDYIPKILMNVEEVGNDLLLFVPKTAIINSIAETLSANKEIKFNKETIPIFVIKKSCQFNEVQEWRNNNKSKRRLLIIGYGRGYSQASDEILKTADETDNDAKEYERKIIISTPVIEAGKTISTLKYCLDSGLELKPCYIPLTYNPYARGNLKLFPINKSAATQRLGRVGREQKGECLRLYTEAAFNKLDNAELPETINNYCLSDVVLSCLKNHQLYKPRRSAIP